MSKTVLVTGGARRLGLGITEHFLDAGWQVHVHYYRSEDKARALAKRSPVTLWRGNLQHVEEIQSLAEELWETTERLDLLVNNAAVFHRTPLQEADSRDWAEHMNLNARAPFFLAQALRERLETSGGSIVNLLDWATQKPYTTYLPYFASKGALETLTRGLARALAPTVRVNGVAPGPIEFPEDHPESQRRKIIDQTPLQRTGTREEVARAVHFLAEQATFTTGTIVQVDGGRHVG